VTISVSEELFAPVGREVELCYQTFGTPDGEPLLLVMGLGGPMTWWDPELCRMLVDRGFHVIRFDNRDSGRSSRGVGRVTRATLLRAAAGRRARAPYSLADMAEDAFGLLDHLGLESAHVCGVSMGGMIAQTMAIGHPERVRSLVLGCTCVLTPDKPRAPIEVNDALLGASRRDLADSTLYGSVCPPEAKVRNHRAILEDHAEPQALVAQQIALRAYDLDLVDVATLTMPALVLHGTEDPIVPVDWGRELAATLPQSRLVIYEGCGHNYLVEVGDAPQREVLDFLAELDAAQPVNAL